MIEVYKELFSHDLENLWDCGSGYMDSYDCSWYHKNWMFLRILGLVSNPLWHKDFYTKSIRSVNQNRPLNTLVLGTADFSMPFLCYQAGIEEIDICDICSTPLNICSTVSEIYSLKWHTFLQDIRKGINKKYGLIIDDAFLTRFEYDDKHLILQKIADALVPDGIYITTIRCGWNNGHVLIPSTEEKINFIERAIKLAVEMNLDVQKVQKAATEYIYKITSYPIKDENHLLKLVNGIFDVQECNLVNVTGECVPSKYFQLVLHKKN